MSTAKTGESPSTYRSWLSRLGWAVVVVHVAAVAWSGYVHTPVLDEIAHLPAGLAVLKLGRTDVYSVNPPAVKFVAALPLLLVDHQEDWSTLDVSQRKRQEWLLGHQFIRLNGRRTWWLMTLARWSCLPFTVMGALVCWKWANEVLGPEGGFVSLLLWCCSPNVIGYASLITPDIPSSSCFLLASYLFHKWLQSGTWPRVFLCGGAFGLLLLVKTQWIILLAIWPILLGCLLWKHDQLRRQNLAQFAVILLLAWNILCAGYGFRGVGTRLGTIPFYSAMLTGETRHPTSAGPDRIQWKFLHDVPSPLPVDFIQGIDRQKIDFEMGRQCYLLGKWYERGHWSFYIVALAVKLPSGLILLLFCGAILVMVHWSRSIGELREFSALFLPAMVLFAIASMQTGLHTYFRYMTPVLPVAYLFAAWTWQSLRQTRLHWFATLCCALCVVESLAVYPHGMSFFNMLSGGSAHGHKILTDANIDWGQDLMFVERWIEDHPEARPITLTTWELFDPNEFGLPPALKDPTKPGPGWHIVSLNKLNWPNDQFNKLAAMTPVDRIGYSHVVIYIPERPDNGEPVTADKSL
ncbi:MAG: glycosyltransferase family 39 protein [Planctomycetaceae bacterium]|nr:glycosyltransferase family 39 protein [Planctomycetaceae bacterium]